MRVMSHTYFTRLPESSNLVMIMKMICKMRKKIYTWIHAFGIITLNDHLILSGADEQTETFQTALLMCIRTT